MLVILPFLEEFLDGIYIIVMTILHDYFTHLLLLDVYVRVCDDHMQ